MTRSQGLRVLSLSKPRIEVVIQMTPRLPNTILHRAHVLCHSFLWHLAGFGSTSGFMEAAGIEPASTDAPGRASTSVVRALLSPVGRLADCLPPG